jgi:hypothetical protein
MLGTTVDQWADQPFAVDNEGGRHGLNRHLG